MVIENIGKIILNNMKKIKYRKIDKDTFERISNKDVVESRFKLKSIKDTREYYKEKHKEMDDLLKLLEALK